MLRPDFFESSRKETLHITYDQYIAEYIISHMKDLVVYFDRNNTQTILHDIYKGLSTIQEKIPKRGKKVVLIEEMRNGLVRDALPYKFPFLKDSDLKDQSIFNAETLLHILQYKGSITQGMIFFDNGINIVEINSSEPVYVVDFISSYLQYLDQVIDRTALVSFCPREIEDDENIQIDHITQKEINTVLDTLDKMRDKGTFIFMLPALQKYIQTHSLQAKPSLLSKLYIDEEFRLILPDYNYLEIKLNYLTKAIYFLFIQHPEGIHLKEMQQYENELMKLYLSVSNQTDIEKMKESVKEVVNPDSNAIYMHLSKIKSAFTKAFCYELASYYFVNGKKNEKKKIALQANLIKWYL